MNMEKFVEIMQTLMGEGETVQTHASVVYMTSEYVYKMKKSVDFGFLNYKQLKSRRAYCYLEKDLNSRFSEGIYLDVMKIIERGQGSYELVPAENTIPALEYVLKMKRVPDALFLSSQLDSISLEKMEYIGAEIAKRLSVAESSPEIVDNLGVFEQVEFNCKENFAQIEESAPQLTDQRYDYIKKLTLAFLEDNKALFIKRHKDGYMKDGHGDLRVEHIYIEGDKISLIDCIEFNNRFRINDVMNEAAFLSMELDYSGKIELSDAFLKGFFKTYSDADSRKLLNFYRCYRAVVRAKVAMFTMLGFKEGDKEHSEKLAEYHRMMDMALSYALSMNSLKPLVFCGMIATGKSVNAKAFTERFPVKRINTDEQRKILAGMGITDNGVTEYVKGLYTKENSMKVYSMMGQQAVNAMDAGRIPLVDGTFMKKDYLNSFAAELPVKAAYIEFTAAEDVIVERLKAREGQENVSDGRLHHYEKMKENADKLERDLFLSGTDKPEDNINKILGYLYNA